jgi:hypothetical protein
MNHQVLMFQQIVQGSPKNNIQHKDKVKICWRFLCVGPGSPLGFQKNPTNHRPFWRPEGNIVHNAVSPEMAYG